MHLLWACYLGAFSAFHADAAALMSRTTMESAVTANDNLLPSNTTIRASTDDRTGSSNHRLVVRQGLGDRVSSIMGGVRKLIVPSTHFRKRTQNKIEDLNRRVYPQEVRIFNIQTQLRQPVNRNSPEIISQTFFYSFPGSGALLEEPSKQDDWSQLSGETRRTMEFRRNIPYTTLNDDDLSLTGLLALVASHGCTLEWYQFNLRVVDLEIHDKARPYSVIDHYGRNRQARIYVSKPNSVVVKDGRNFFDCQGRRLGKVRDLPLNTPF